MSTLNTEVTTDYFRESHSVPNPVPNLSLSHLIREKKPTLDCRQEAIFLQVVMLSTPNLNARHRNKK